MLCTEFTLRCPKCGICMEWVRDNDALCPECLHRIKPQGGIYDLTQDTEPGFSYRWGKHPDPQKGIENFLNKTGWRPEDLSGKVVLDAGCGCGQFLKVLRDIDVQLVGIDVSMAALEAAAKVLEGRKAPWTLVHANLLTSVLGEGCVDAAYSIGVLHHTANPALGFEQVARWVKPGGRLAVWVYVTHTDDPVARMAMDFLHAITKRCQPGALYEAIAEWAPRVRDAYAGSWGPLQQVLRVSNLEDDEQCISDTYDWHCPQYRFGHTLEEVRCWYRDNGYSIEWTGEFPVSLRGVKERGPYAPA